MNKLRKIGFLVLAFVCAVFAFASCKPKGPTAEQAAARISTTQDKQTITGDFVVNSQVVLEGVTFTVTWTSDNAVAKVGTEKVDKDGKASETGAFYLVTIDYENNTADQTVKLTATVANGKDTATKSISFTVPKFTTLSYAEFAAADDDTSVTVDGIVTGIISKDSKGNSSNALYVNALDSTGGFYVYNLTTDPIADGIREGMTVRVSGLKDTYNGTLEIVSATVKVTDSNVKTVAPVDLTKAFTDAEDTKAEALVGGQALLVTIKGVTIGSINADNGYYNFSLAGKESYVRISSSVCPLTSEQQKTFKEDFASHTGYLANVTGVVCIYNGAFYLTPVAANAVEYLSLPELSDAEQVAYEKEGLDLANTKFAADATIDLPLKGSAYKDVVITWASNSEQVVVDATKGTAAITLGTAAVEVKLTATLTKGEASVTKEFTLELEKALALSIVDPVDGQEFYFGLYQANLGKYLFFTGVPKEGQLFYQTTTEELSESVKVKVTAVTGGYTLSFVEGTTTKYITMSVNSENKTSLDIVTDASKAAVFTYDTEHQTFIQTIGEDKLFMGANKTYNTISASWHKYLESNFPVHLYSFLSDEELVALDKEALTIEQTEVILDFTLPVAGKNGSTITWASNNAAIAISGANATVTQPAVGAEDVTVKLTATITIGEASVTKEFNVVVKAESSDPNVGLVAADKAALTIENTTVSANFTLPVAGTNGSTIVWTVKSGTGIAVSGANATVTRPEFSAGNATVVLTATLTKGEVTDTKEFTFTVVCDNELTVAEFLAAKNQTTEAVLTGFITAVNKIGESGSFVLTDTEGNSVFCYDGLDVKLGDEVIISGKYGVNSDHAQISSPKLIEKVSEGNNAAAKSGTIVNVNASDILALLTATGSTNATMFETYGGKYLAIKGYIIKNGDYYNLAVAQGGTKAVNIYANKDINVSALVDKEVVVYGFARGSKITNTDKYLTVQVQSISEKELTTAEKLALDKEALSVVSEAAENITLPATGAQGSTITWASSNAAVLSNAGVVVRPAAGQADVTVTLTATLTLGGETATKEFTVVVKAIPSDPNEEAVRLDKEALTVSATVTENFVLVVEGANGSAISWVSNNAAIAIEGANATVTRPAFASGDATVKLVATISKGDAEETKEFTVIVTKLAAVEPEVTTKTVAELIALTTEMDAKYKVVGVIKSWGNKPATPDANPAKYGNFVLEDGENTIIVYGSTETESAITWNASTAKYEYKNQQNFLTGSLTSTLALGDEVELLVLRTSFSGTPQLNAVVLRKVEATDAELVQEAHDALELEVEETIVNFTLPLAGLNETVISWASNNTAVIAIEGANATVTQPANGSGAATVTLTATITLNEATLTKEFTVVVAEESLDPNVALLAADKEALTVAATVTENFELVVEGANGSAISWVSNNAAIAIEGANATVTRPEFSLGNATVTLTATLTLGEVEDTKEFTVVVTKADAVAPEAVEKTIAELLAIETADEMKATYLLTATVKGLGQNGNDTTAGQYGNFIVTDGNNDILVYGATATASALTWGTNTGKYTWSNPKDFLTNALTKDIKARDVLEMTVVRTSYNGTIELYAIILDVTPYEFTDEEKAEMDLAEVKVPTTTVENLVLPTVGSKYESEFSWASSDVTIIANDGSIVARPDTTTTVTLTLTVVQGDYTTTETYEVEVPAVGEEVEEAPSNTYSHAFASGQLSTTGGEKTLSGLSWNCTTATYVGWDSNGRGVQIGSKNNPQASWTMTASSYEYKISKITVNACTGGTSTLSIYVNGVAVAENVSLGSSSNDYAYELATPAQGGEIRIVLASTSKAMYIKSIKIES